MVWHPEIVNAKAGEFDVVVGALVEESERRALDGGGRRLETN